MWEGCAHSSSLAVQVYAATWLETRVAVKYLITEGSLAEKQFLEDIRAVSEVEEDFLNEIALMSSCFHPNIVTFFSACMQPDQVRKMPRLKMFLIMLGLRLG